MKADREIKVRCSACGHLTRIPTVTNADRIRASTDEELARFLSATEFKRCDYRPVQEYDFAVWFEWLRKDADSAYWSKFASLKRYYSKSNSGVGREIKR